jgi:hypothetical protein
MAPLVFNAKIMGPHGTDLHSCLLSLGTERVPPAYFPHQVTGLIVHFSNWLQPKQLRVNGKLTLAKLRQIVRHQLLRKLTPTEKREIRQKHRDQYRDEPEPGMYARAAHAFHPVELPQWRLERVGDTTVYKLIGFR